MSEFLWLPHPTLVWVPAKVIENDGGICTFETVHGESLTLSVDKVDPKTLERVSENSLKEENNLVNLDEFGEGAVIHQLRERYANDKIYTNIGTILCSVNPYKLLPIYGAAQVEMYKNAANAGANALAALSPHVFSIAAEAYSRLYEEDESPSTKHNQAVIISGESGAGKTEATKTVLQYLSEVAGSVSGVEQQILQSNPILESFGNAKTLRNNNSSRFGKWMEIHFEPANSSSSGRRIIAARIVNYLLEQSRVTVQTKGERSYHILYSLCAGLDESLKQKFDLKTPQEYCYLNQGNCYEIPGVDEVEEFHSTSKAMTDLKFSDETINSIWQLLIAILQIGNLKPMQNPEKNDLTIISNKDHLVRTAETLGLPSADVLSSALCYRSVTIRGSLSMIPLNVAEVEANRDALARTIYSKLFDYIIVTMNKVLFESGDSTPLAQKSDAAKKHARSIGILDIFGFEIFEKNLFEQFCINYANEKLQQHFNLYIFKLEQLEYEAEGIDVAHISFSDNLECLHLIENRPSGASAASSGAPSYHGILSMLDEELLIPRGSDASLITKMHAAFNTKGKEHKHYDVLKKNPEIFIIKHYAADVQYSSQGLLAKNKNKLNDNLESLMAGGSSSLKLVTDIFNPAGSANASAEEEKKEAAAPASSSVGPRRSGQMNSPSNASKKKESSLAFQFWGQLNELMATLHACTPHYIRCLKSNANKQPKEFDTRMVLNQMSYAGLFEAIRIRKSGFPFRKLLAEFGKRYKVCLEKAELVQYSNTLNEKAKSDVDLRNAVSYLLQCLAKTPHLVSGEYSLGKTKVFLKGAQRNRLDAFRDASLLKWVIQLQSVFRMVHCRRLKKALKAFQVRVLDAFKQSDLNPEVLANLTQNAQEQGYHHHLFILQQVTALTSALEEVVRVTGQLEAALQAKELEALEGALEQVVRLTASHEKTLLAPNGANSFESSPYTLLQTLSSKTKLATAERDHLLEARRLQQQLREAIMEESIPQLQAALGAAEKFGLDPHLSVMVQALKLLKQLLEEEALMENLRQATKAKDVVQLEVLITRVQREQVALDAARTTDLANACTTMHDEYARMMRELMTPAGEPQLKSYVPKLTSLNYQDVLTEVQTFLREAEEERQRQREREAREREEARRLEEERLAAERAHLAEAERLRLEEEDRQRRAVEEQRRLEAEAAEAAARAAAEAQAAAQVAAASSSSMPPPPLPDDHSSFPPPPDGGDMMPPPPAPEDGDMPPPPAPSDDGLPPPPPTDDGLPPPPPDFDLPPPPSDDASSPSTSAPVSFAPPPARPPAISFAGPATLAEHPVDKELDAAIIKRSLPALEKAIASANALKHQSRLLRVAQNMVQNLQAESRIKSELRQALNVVDVEKCKALIKQATAIGFLKDPSGLIEEARSVCYVLSPADLLSLRIQKALPQGNADQLRLLLKEASDAKPPLANEWVEQAKDWLAAQLTKGSNRFSVIANAADSLESFRSIDWNTTMRLNRTRMIPHDLYEPFATSRGQFPMNDTNFPPLRRPGNFAKKQYFSKSSLKEGQWIWQNESMPRSLVKLSTEYCGGKQKSLAIKQQAKQIFKNIRGYMKDSYHTYPATLAFDIVTVGVQQPLLRDEIFCLLIKQTSNNPSGDSLLLGLKLLFLCLSTFPPSPALKPCLWSHISTFAHSSLPTDALGLQLPTDVASFCFIALEHVAALTAAGIPIKLPAMSDIEMLTAGTLAKRSAKFGDMLKAAQSSASAVTIDADFDLPPPE